MRDYENRCRLFQEPIVPGGNRKATKNEPVLMPKKTIGPQNGLAAIVNESSSESNEKSIGGFSDAAQKSPEEVLSALEYFFRLLVGKRDNPKKTLGSTILVSRKSHG